MCGSGFGVDVSSPGEHQAGGVHTTAGPALGESSNRVRRGSCEVCKICNSKRECLRTLEERWPYFIVPLTLVRHRN